VSAGLYSRLSLRDRFAAAVRLVPSWGSHVQQSGVRIPVSVSC
jgi:hypothetical protein